jgi:hypothetical protein
MRFFKLRIAGVLDFFVKKIENQFIGKFSRILVYFISTVFICGLLYVRIRPLQPVLQRIYNAPHPPKGVLHVRSLVRDRYGNIYDAGRGKNNFGVLQTKGIK